MARFVPQLTLRILRLEYTIFKTNQFLSHRKHTASSLQTQTD
jgi:hypothetical protein